MHCGFVDMSQGIRTPSVNSLTNGSAPFHTRMGSGPAPMPGSTYSQSHRSGHLPTVKPRLSQANTPLPGASDLLDPLVDFSPGQLSSENHRLSVAW